MGIIFHFGCLYFLYRISLIPYEKINISNYFSGLLSKLSRLHSSSVRKGNIFNLCKIRRWILFIKSFKDYIPHRLFVSFVFYFRETLCYQDQRLLRAYNSIKTHYGQGTVARRFSSSKFVECVSWLYSPPKQIRSQSNFRCFIVIRPNSRPFR